MRILVSPYFDVQRVAVEYPLTGVISLLGEADRLAWPHFDLPQHRVLRLAFDDVMADRLAGGSKRPTHLKAPTHDDIRALIEFANSLKADDTLMCHCRAGTSRSPAAAAIAAAVLGASKSEIEALVCLKNYFSPSLAMLKLFADIAPPGLPDLVAIASEKRPWVRADPWGPAGIEFTPMSQKK